MAGSRALIDWLVQSGAAVHLFDGRPSGDRVRRAGGAGSSPRSPSAANDSWPGPSGFASELAGQGWNVGRSASQIIPIVVGDPGRALELSAALRRRRIVSPSHTSADGSRGRGLSAHQSDRRAHGGDDRRPACCVGRKKGSELFLIT